MYISIYLTGTFYCRRISFSIKAFLNEQLKQQIDVSVKTDSKKKKISALITNETKNHYIM
jgi:hypothetical protein